MARCCASHMEKTLKIFESLSIIAVDIQGAILFFNEGAEKLFGYDSRDMVGKRTIDILYPADDPKTMRVVEEAREKVFGEKKRNRLRIGCSDQGREAAVDESSSLAAVRRQG